MDRDECVISVRPVYDEESVSIAISAGETVADLKQKLQDKTG